MAFGLLASAALAVALFSLATICVTISVATPELDSQASYLSTSICCTRLAHVLGSQVSYPNTSAYIKSLESYWSYQEEAVLPACIVRPQSAADVSKAVSVLTFVAGHLPTANASGCDFAIRSGGHTAFAGAANIDGGVTIDLSGMKDIVVSHDRTVVSVGPGATWDEVYLVLDAQNLSTSGGRVATVGVGGLALGGGISFFAPRYGFVCDNVLNHEIVLASGAIVNANAISRPDLHWALKGGSNNFGVVTRFDFRAFEQGKFWGGFVAWPLSTKEAQFHALADITNAAPYDPYVSIYLSVSWGYGTGQWLVSSEIQYTQPIAYPSVLAPITDIQPQLFNTMRISNLTDFAIELEGKNPGGRWIYATITFGADATLFSKIFDICNSSLQAVQDVPNLGWSTTYEPLPSAITAHAASSGGNALGLDPSDGNLVVVVFDVYWLDDAYDAVIAAAAKQMVEQANQAAEEMGLASGYLYLNYADAWQDPIAGYGVENVERLRAVSRRYDPAAVFQKRVPGGFKLC